MPRVGYGYSKDQTGRCLILDSPPPEGIKNKSCNFSQSQWHTHFVWFQEAINHLCKSKKGGGLKNLIRKELRN